MTINTTLIDNQIEELTERIYGLECSDDMLFSNANGNLPRWQELVAERNRLMAVKWRAQGRG